MDAESPTVCTVGIEDDLFITPFLEPTSIWE
jgi:hypothetical protein